MVSTLIGASLAFSIGYGCRFFNLPLPAPPKLLGALLVVAMSIGFVGMDALIIGR